MDSEVHKKVREWLEQTIENSEQAVDHGWKVETSEENERFMLIDSPKMPFKIVVTVEDDITYLAFITGLKFAGQDPAMVAPIYRDLLVQNNSMSLSKFCIMGDDDTLTLRTDLYSHYMDKKEFNLALESIIMGGRWLIAQVGQTEDQNIMAKEMADLGSAELLKGTSEEEVIEKMVKAGFPDDQARLLVAQLQEALGLKEGEQVPRTPGTGMEPSEDNPVDNYIW